jgi:hypothetical protein
VAHRARSGLKKLKGLKKGKFKNAKHFHQVGSEQKKFFAALDRPWIHPIIKKEALWSLECTKKFEQLSAGERPRF